MPKLAVRGSIIRLCSVQWCHHCSMHEVHGHHCTMCSWVLSDQYEHPPPTIPLWVTGPLPHCTLWWLSYTLNGSPNTQKVLDGIYILWTNTPSTKIHAQYNASPTYQWMLLLGYVTWGYNRTRADRVTSTTATDTALVNPRPFSSSEPGASVYNMCGWEKRRMSDIAYMMSTDSLPSTTRLINDQSMTAPHEQSVRTHMS